MKTNSRHLEVAALAASSTALLASLLAASLAHAQDYPSKPIEVIVPFSAGGGVDALARSFAQGMDTRLKQRTVVQNRDGGSTIIGMSALANAPADGYTMLYGPVTALTIHPHRMKNLPFKVAAFTPVCQTFENIFFVAARPNSPIKDFDSLLAGARAEPGKFSYAHPGPASSPHLAGAELFAQAGVKLNDIPFKGESVMAPQLLSGEVDVGIVTMSMVASQGLKPLAVFAKSRMPGYESTPTIGEKGYDVQPSTYGGIFMKTGTSQDIVSKVEAACRDTVDSASYKELAGKQHQLPSYLDHAAFASRIAADSRAKEKLIPTLKIEE